MSVRSVRTSGKVEAGRDVESAIIDAMKELYRDPNWGAFATSASSRVTIVLTDEIDTAAVNSMKGHIYMNPKFVSELLSKHGKEGLKWVLLHEIMHVVLLHPKRINRLSRELGVGPHDMGTFRKLANIVTDGLINEYLVNTFKSSFENEPIIRWRDVVEVARRFNAPVGDHDEESFETVIRRIWRHAEKEKSMKKSRALVSDSSGQKGGDGNMGSPDTDGETSRKTKRADSREGGEEDNPIERAIKEAVEGRDHRLNPAGDASEDREVSGGKVVKEGSEEPIDEESVEEMAKEMEATEKVMRSAGTVPSSLLRHLAGIVEEEPLDWRRLLRYVFGDVHRRNFITDMSRESRRVPGLPGTKRNFAKSNVWAVVDVSGSIGEEELKRFMGTLYNLVKRHGVNLNLVFFDVGPRKIIEGVDKPEKFLRELSSFPGGGGTMLRDTFDVVRKKMGKGDLVVLLTDGYILDLEDPEVLRSAMEVASKGRLAAVYTEVPLPYSFAVQGKMDV